MTASLFLWVVYHERLESLDKMTTDDGAGIMCIKEAVIPVWHLSWLFTCGGATVRNVLKGS